MRAGACRVLTLMAVATMGCATRAPVPRVIDLSAADQALAAGCYTCLLDARDRYEAALTVSEAPRALAGAFDASLLLVLREKELGLPSVDSLARAHELAVRQTAPDRAAAIADLAAEARGELAGIDPEERTDRMSRRRGPPPRVEPPLVPEAGAIASPALAYLWLTLECEHPQARRWLDASAVETRAGQSPLIGFRWGLCDQAIDTFQSLRTADPRWTELDFFEGRLLAGDPRTLAEGVAALGRAHDALPASLAITMRLADAERTLGDAASALGHYDEVLREAPTHRAALVGRTFALTDLERHEEGIESASRLIELGRWYLGDAYYLRAWNEYQVKSLDAAWNDAEQATTIRGTTEVFMLAGLVAYAKKDLDASGERFARAWTLDRANCSAAQYLGIVQAEQSRWTDAAPIFSTAMQCFTKAAADARAALAEIEAADTPPDFKARQAAARRETIDESKLQEARCAYNAAQAYARQGRRDEARRYLATAREHPELRREADALLHLLEPK